MRATNYLDNYYARLGISRTATLDEIHQAYRSATRRFHPDADKKTGRDELFQLVQEAYDTLSNREKRRAYDSSLPPDIDTPTSIMVNALYSRNQITPGEANQVIYVLLDLMAAGAGDREGRPPLNVCLVLDSSTSMAGSRLGQVVKAANHFLEQVQPQDFLSIVTFNDRADLVIPAQSGRDNRRLQSRISTLQTRGGTEIYQGLQLGLHEIRRNLRPNHINHLVLITDGRTYGDEEACLLLAGQASELGVPISAVGIGEEWNEVFIDQLVARGGGSSLYADRSTEIYKLLEGRLNTLGHCFANNVKLHFEAGPQSRLHFAFRLSPDPGALPSESPLYLGAIPTETSLSVLLEFEVNASQLQQGDLVLAEGELRLDIPTRSVPSTKARFRLSRPVQEIELDTDGPSQVIINAIGKLSLYRMQEQARQDIEAGDLVGAAKRMRMLATHLLSNGQKGLAQTVLLAADDIKRSGVLGEKTGKQIKYGTRALIAKHLAKHETEQAKSRRRGKR
ncbi:MAG: VWA domain-containing protein [Chloroflexi bacterium]|nr:VWA domain-containing protein [Chloroflexota bacterium]